MGAPESNWGPCRQNPPQADFQTTLKHSPSIGCKVSATIGHHQDLAASSYNLLPRRHLRASVKKRRTYPWPSAFPLPGNAPAP